MSYLDEMLCRIAEREWQEGKEVVWDEWNSGAELLLSDGEDGSAD